MMRPLLCLFALALALAPPLQAAEPPVVLAAASLSEALEAVAADWVGRGHPPPLLSFAASSTLARQIEAGAPADIFAGADEAWMDHLEARGLIVPGSRVSPIGNALVVIAPRAAPPPRVDPAGIDPAGLADLLPPGRRLALADPDHVPAGRYARAALEQLGLWEALAGRLAPAENVRAALVLVARHEAPLGIVYATDARIEPAVREIARLPADSHPPITYPFALVAGRDRPEAAAFLAFATGPEGRALFRRFGFTTP